MVIEFRRPARYVWKRRKAQTVMGKQAAAIPGDRRRHGQLRRGEFEGEGVLLVDGRIGPAFRPIELEHPQDAVFVAKLIDAILVAVEREQPARRLEPDAFRRGKDRLRVQ
jgi:hypothetical protein